MATVMTPVREVFSFPVECPVDYIIMDRCNPPLCEANTLRNVDIGAIRE